MSKQTDQTHKSAQSKPVRPKTPPVRQHAPVDNPLLQLAREDPARLTPAQRTQLQRTLGNRTLSQLAGNQNSVISDQSSSPLHPFTPSPVHPFIQTKLTVNAVGDKYEQEADTVAKEVVQKLNTPQTNAAAGIPSAPPTHAQRQTEEGEPIAQRIQRQEIDEKEVMPQRIRRQEVPEEENLQLQRQETEDEELQLQRQELEEEEPEEMVMLQREAAPEEEELQLQRQEMPEEEEMQLQRQALEEEDPEQMAMTQRQPQDFTNGGPVDSHIETQINQSRGGGRPMEDSIRQPMEQAFGADFSDVRIHTDAQAHNLNEAIQARAFTTGNDIYFKEGEYRSPDSTGQELLAHELTHAVQQTESAKPKISPKQDSPIQETQNLRQLQQVNKNPTNWLPLSKNFIARTVSPHYPKIKKKLSYGIFDWVITDQEAKDVLNYLSVLSPIDLNDTVKQMKQDGFVDRLLANIGEDDRSTYASLIQEIEFPKPLTDISTGSPITGNSPSKSTQDTIDPEQKLSENNIDELVTKFISDMNLKLEEIRKKKQEQKSGESTKFPIISLEISSTKVSKSRTPKEQANLVVQGSTKVCWSSHMVDKARHVLLKVDGKISWDAKSALGEDFETFKKSWEDLMNKHNLKNAAGADGWPSWDQFHLELPKSKVLRTDVGAQECLDEYARLTRIEGKKKTVVLKKSMNHF